MKYYDLELIDKLVYIEWKQEGCDWHKYIVSWIGEFCGEWWIELTTTEEDAEGYSSKTFIIRVSDIDTVSILDE